MCSCESRLKKKSWINVFKTFLVREMLNLRHLGSWGDALSLIKPWACSPSGKGFAPSFFEKVVIRLTTHKMSIPQAGGRSFIKRPLIDQKELMGEKGLRSKQLAPFVKHFFDGHNIRTCCWLVIFRAKHVPDTCPLSCTVIGIRPCIISCHWHAWSCCQWLAIIGDKYLPNQLSLACMVVVHYPA